MGLFFDAKVLPKPQNFCILPVYKIGIPDVKGFSRLLILALLPVAMLIVPRASAQQFALSVTASDTSIMVSNSVTYTIMVTNLGVDLSDTFVTNLFSSSQLQTNLSYSAFSSQGTNFATTNAVVFELGSFFAGQSAQLTLMITPTAAGFLTNSITVADPAETTNMVFTNVVVQVTNSVPTEADLGVMMTGPKQVVITNDWMTYRVTVTNAGPDSATSVVLTNFLPQGVIQISPTNKPATNSIPIGTLSNGSSTNLFFTVEPTNVATRTFSVSVGSETPDTNTANNLASTNITVTNYLPGTIEAIITSPQVTNWANGLIEQTILLTNTGAISADSARVVITGLTNRLYNAFGTNNGNPFVVYASTLTTNQSVNLLLQFAVPTISSFPLSNSQLNAFPVFKPDLSPPATTMASTNINTYRILKLSNGNVMIEWPTTFGKTYTVVYSDNVSFSNAMIAPPSIVAPGNRTQWVDYGPPTTVSLPTNTARFYRVIQNP